MASVTAAKQTPLKGPFRKVTYKLKAGAKVIKGAFVQLDTATGFVVDAAEAAGRLVVGIAESTVDNTGGANGDLTVEVICDCLARVVALSIAAANAGAVMFLIDNQTIDDVAGANSVKCGVLVEFVSATEGIIYLPAAPAIQN